MSGFGNFKSPSNLTPLEKIASQTVNTTGSGAQKLSPQSIGPAMSNKLSSAGLSVGAIASTVSTGLDNAIGKLKSDVTTLTQKITSRTKPADLINKRKSDKGSKKKFAESHMPQRKIADSRVTRVGTLSYPPDMRKYYINFAFGKYERPNPYLEKSAFSPNFHVALPMPSNLIDPSGVKLKTAELGGVLGAAAENVSAIIQDIKAGGSTGSPSAGTAKNIANQAVGAVYATAYEVASAIPGLDDIAGTAGQLLGAVPNPHVTVFFQGVDLRTHSFTWRFAPKNVTESIIVQTIVREFKKRMLPNYKWGAANILGYPEMVQITLEPEMEMQLYKFKPCMISAVNVNYAPNGVPSFFSGTKYPTAIEFQVNFQELEIFTSQDYGGTNGDFAGTTGEDIKNSFNEITGKIAQSKAKDTGPK